MARQVQPKSSLPGNRSASSSALRVRVTRSGGFGGLVTTFEVSTANLKPEEQRQLEEATERLGLESMPRRPDGPGQPDRFQYDIEVRKARTLKAVTAHEPDLSVDLKALIELVQTLSKV